MKVLIDDDFSELLEIPALELLALFAHQNEQLVHSCLHY
jgi:hypothetical protein